MIFLLTIAVCRYMIYLIKWTCIITCKLLKWIFVIGIAITIAFIFLCLNLVTVPIYLLSLLLCTNKPRLAHYALMLYPSWKQPYSSPSFACDVIDWDRRTTRKAQTKARQDYALYPWEWY